MYDYHLGGVHNFPVDRDVAEQMAAVMPDLPLILRANRAFLLRAVRFLADAGIRQFLDLGSGIPTVENVHEIAQRIAPESRIAYVDADPVAVAHGRELLRDNPYATAVQADLRNVAGVLRAPEVSALIDFSQPVGLLMVAVLHFVSDSDDVDSVLAGYRHALAPGSYLAISHAAGDRDALPEGADQARTIYSRRVSELTLRSRAEVTTMFDSLDLVNPGVVPIEEWHPNNHLPRLGLTGWVGVARKPVR